VGESGGSAERRAEMLRASGDADAAAWAAGAEGERRVAEALASLGSPWVVLHDRLLRPGLTESNLDHVVVGPPGVILVDAKNWGGNVTEYEGGLYQHRWDAAGQGTHESKHGELAKVHAMGREMAERLAGPVTPVLCLAGSRSSAFGEPQMVRGVWVVPVGMVSEWVAGRPRIVADDALHQLSTLVMTEFPSTTTDPELLAAIGADLARRVPVRRRGAPRRPSVRVTGGRAGGSAPRSPGGRTRRSLRPLIGLALIAALWWVLSSGLFASLARIAGAAVSEFFTRGIGVASPAATPDRLGCEDVDTARSRILRKAELVAASRPWGCEWLLVDSNGKQVTVMRLQELIGATEQLNPMLERSRTSGHPERYDSASLSGPMTTLWVAAGVPLSTAHDANASTRSLTVQVAYEQLGLTATQGRQLAAALARSASAHHEPLATRSPTPTSRS
jgi:hypothetical protein